MNYCSICDVAYEPHNCPVCLGNELLEEATKKNEDYLSEIDDLKSQIDDLEEKIEELENE